MKGERNKDAQKGDYLSVQVEIWDGIEWAYGGDRESEALNILWESMLRFWRRKLRRELAQALRRVLGSWKWVGYSQGIREVS